MTPSPACGPKPTFSCNPRCPFGGRRPVLPRLVKTPAAVHALSPKGARGNVSLVWRRIRDRSRAEPCSPHGSSANLDTSEMTTPALRAWVIANRYFNAYGGARPCAPSSGMEDARRSVVEIAGHAALPPRLNRRRWHRDGDCLWRFQSVVMNGPAHAHADVDNGHPTFQAMVAVVMEEVGNTD